MDKIEREVNQEIAHNLMQRKKRKLIHFIKETGDYQEGFNITLNLRYFRVVSKKTINTDDVAYRIKYFRIAWIPLGIYKFNKNRNIEFMKDVKKFYKKWGTSKGVIHV